MDPGRWRPQAAVVAAQGSALVWAIPARAQDGAASFRSRCASCHSVEAGQNRVGPTLAGILGRVSGSEPGARYSQAMRDAKLTWDSQTLDEYLAAPQSRVPGTTMPIKVPAPEQRASIIDYLASLPEGGKAPGS